MPYQLTQEMIRQTHYCSVGSYPLAVIAIRSLCNSPENIAILY